MYIYPEFKFRFLNLSKILISFLIILRILKIIVHSSLFWYLKLICNEYNKFIYKHYIIIILLLYKI